MVCQGCSPGTQVGSIGGLMSKETRILIGVLLVIAAVVILVMVVGGLHILMAADHSKEHTCMRAGYQGYEEVGWQGYCWRYRGGRGDIFMRPMDKIRQGGE